jgi:RNA-directed DNA polymerase
LTLVPKAGAQCGNSARWDLRGGPPARAVPTATGTFYRTEMYALLRRINTYLMRWARRKFKRLRAFKRFRSWWYGLMRREPDLFVHWAWMPDF